MPTAYEVSETFDDVLFVIVTDWKGYVIGAGTSCVWKFNEAGCAPRPATSGNMVANASKVGDTPT